MTIVTSRNPCVKILNIFIDQENPVATKRNKFNKVKYIHKCNTEHIS